MQKSDMNTIEKIPGCARQVWGGWVWVVGFSGEQPWSKRSTQDECERVVVEVVERLGVDAAFEEG